MSMVPGVIGMLLLFLVVMVLVTIGVAAVWCGFEDRPGGEGGPGGATADLPHRAEAARPETLEGALVAQLVAGEITKPQYLRAMQRLAARDEERHPLAVPPETGSADA